MITKRGLINRPFKLLTNDFRIKANVTIGVYSFQSDIHSLRYNAACDLALAGLDDVEIGSVTGQTTQTVQHYTKSARQMANAKRAINAREKMLGAKREKARIENIG